MKQSQKKGKKNKIGAIGEKIAARFLKNKGFTILDQNYLKKWGEIDLIARKKVKNKQTIHFIEVKTVSYETKTYLNKARAIREWRPEERVTREKLQKMHRTIESWLGENNSEDIDWQIDVVAVRVVPHEKYATVKYIQNVII